MLALYSLSKDTTFQSKSKHYMNIYDQQLEADKILSFTFQKPKPGTLLLCLSVQETLDSLFKKRS